MKLKKVSRALAPQAQTTTGLVCHALEIIFDSRTSMSFPFCCCLFSLYVKEVNSIEMWKRRDYNTRENWVLGNEIVKDCCCCFVPYIFFSSAAMQTNFLISNLSRIYIEMERQWALSHRPMQTSILHKPKGKCLRKYFSLHRRCHSAFYYKLIKKIIKERERVTAKGLKRRRWMWKLNSQITISEVIMSGTLAEDCLGVMSQLWRFIFLLKKEVSLDMIVASKQSVTNSPNTYSMSTSLKRSEIEIVGEMLWKFHQQRKWK